jgi:hypothetical protein
MERSAALSVESRVSLRAAAVAARRATPACLLLNRGAPPGVTAARQRRESLHSAPSELGAASFAYLKSLRWICGTRPRSASPARASRRSCCWCCCGASTVVVRSSSYISRTRAQTARRGRAVPLLGRILVARAAESLPTRNRQRARRGALPCGTGTTANGLVVAGCGTWLVILA